MKKLIQFLLCLSLASVGYAKTVSTVTISPAGVSATTGSTIQFTAACTYTDSTSDSNCASAGTLTWYTSRTTISTVNSTGLVTLVASPAWSPSHAYALGAQVTDANGETEVCITAGTSGTTVTWPTRGSPQDWTGNQVSDGSVVWQQISTAITGTGVVVSAQGITDGASIYIQTPGDTWYQYLTPDYRNYTIVSSATVTQLPLNVAVGSTIAMGSAIVNNSSSTGTGNPFTGCTWTSSDVTKATVNHLGQVTGVAPGTVNISCVNTGNAVFGSSSLAGWVSPGNVITLTVVNGGTSNTTWYVRPKGGMPYVNNTITPVGQCNGTSDLDYPGPTGDIWHAFTTYTVGTQIAERSGHTQIVTTAGVSGSGSTGGPAWNGTVGGTTTDGTVVWTTQALYPVNQSCAMGQLSYLYNDLNSYESQTNSVNPNGWMIRGGDTVIVRQNSKGYDIGWDNNGTFGGPANCYGNGYGCFMPTIPSGTSSQHTRILGENYASCTADSAKTLIHETWGVEAAFNTTDSQFVDIGCFELTDITACAGTPHFTNYCDGTTSTGTEGIVQSALTASVNYSNLFIHGLAMEGIHGPTGIGVVADHIHIKDNPFGGIDMDDGPWQLSSISVAGGFTLTNSITEFSGCVEEYPVVHNYPIIECKGQNLGAYGDGFGTGSTSGDWTFDHDIWRYNLQDGLDLLHSGMRNLTVTNSYSYGNLGQTFKLGDARNVLFRNNLALANCNRLAQTIGDEPSSAVPTGEVFCRAGDNVPILEDGNGTYIIESNSIGGYMATPFDIICGWDDCTTRITTEFRDNAVFGISNPNYNGGSVPGLFEQAQLFPNQLLTPNNGWTTRDHNNYYNMRAGYCSMTLFTGETCTETTGTALFTSMPASPISTESALDNYNFAVPSASPLKAAGLYNAANTTDYNGFTRVNPTAIGALEYGSISTVTLSAIAVTPNPGSVTTGSTLTFSASCSYSDGSTTPCSGTWTDTAAHSSISSTTGVVTGVSVGSDTITYTISSVTGTATVTISAPGGFIPWQGAHIQGKIN